MTSALHSPLSIINSPLPSGYKQTEVGVIPEEWETQSGEQLTTLIGKGASPRWQGFEYSNRGMLFVTSENVRDGFLDVREPKYLPLAFHEKLKRTKLQKHDILINLVGASIGRSCQLLQDLGEANVNQAVAVFRVKGEICSEFIACCFQAPTTINRILEMQVDAARPNVSLSDLRQFLIPLPPLPEQRAIATALSDVDALLGGLDRLIAKKRDLKQAAMQQLLTGQTRLPGFTGEWEVKTMSEVCWFQEGPGVRNTQFTASGVKLLNGTNIFRGVLNLETTSRFISEKEAHGAYAHFLADEGDIVLASSGITIERLHEKVAFVSARDLPFCMNTSTIRFKPSAGILDPKFLFQFLTSDAFKRPIGGQATGSAQLNFGPSHVAKINISTPPLPEQTAIAAVLTDMDAELAVLEQRLAKTRDLKQGMMQELLTGKTRLV